MNTLTKNLADAISVKHAVLQNQQLLNTIQELTSVIINAYHNGNKVLFCGNGGSAADAQHLAAELSGRYYYDRPPLFAEALHVNSSYLTAVANDYSYDEVFSRLIKAMGKKGDVLIGFSTSGNSPNVVNALTEARKTGMITAAFTGAGGGKLKNLCDYWVGVPSDNTPRIQECHMIIGHSICEEVEKQLFPRP